MKKLFTVLGVIFAVVLAIIAIAAAIFIPRALKLNREATAYIQDAVPKIVGHWNSQELVDRATPELLAAGESRDKLDKLFVMFQRLGSFKHLDQPRGMVVSSAYTGTGTVTLGNYKAQAEFEKKGEGKDRHSAPPCGRHMEDKRLSHFFRCTASAIGLTSRRSQPPLCPSVASERRRMALAIPRPRSGFTSRVGGGAGFYFRHHYRYEHSPPAFAKTRT